MDKQQALSVAREMQLERSSAEPVFLHGPTMRPLFRDGDYIEVVPATLEEVQVDDIVTLREEHRYPTRRIVAIDLEQRTLSVQADYTPGQIDVVPGEDLLGKVVARVRNGQRIDSGSLRWRLAAWTAPVQKKLLRFWRRSRRRLRESLRA